MIGKPSRSATMRPPRAAAGIAALSRCAPGTVLAEHDRGEVAAPVQHRQRQAEPITAHAHGHAQHGRARRQRQPAQRRRAGRAQPPRQRRPRFGREVAAPALDRGERVRRQREQREVAAVVAGDVAGVAQHRRRVPEPRVLRRRRRLLHRHEPLQVLLEYDVGRYGVPRLLAHSRLQRPAVADGEDGDADGDDEEDDGEDHRSGCARERQERDAHGHGRTASGALEQAQRRREQARRHDGEHEDQQPRQDEQHDAGAAAARERSGIGLPAREREQDRRERTERRDVGDRDPHSAERDRLGAHGDEHHDGDQHGEHDGHEQAAQGHDRVRDRRRARRAEMPREQRSRSGPEQPAGDRRDKGDREHLGGGDERRLPPARAVPAQPASHRTVIATQPCRCEHRESEQQHRSLAADDQQPPPGHLRRRTDRAQRVGRRREAEQRVGGLEPVLREIEPVLEGGDLPFVDRPRRDGHDPARGARDHARRPEAAVARTRGRRRRGGSAAGSHRRGEVRGERRTRTQRRAADDVEVRQLRRDGSAADLDELAVRRRAGVRQPAAAEHEPAREPVDRAEIDERAAPRRLAEDEHAERRTTQHRMQRRAGDAIELRKRQVRLRRHAAPVHLDGAVGRLQLRERALHRTVLDGDGGDGGQREHRRRDRDSRCDEQRPRRVRAEPREPEPDRDENALDRAAATRSGFAARSVGGDSSRSGRLRPRCHSRKLRAGQPRMQPPTADRRCRREGGAVLQGSPPGGNRTVSGVCHDQTRKARRCSWCT